MRKELRKRFSRKKRPDPGTENRVDLAGNIVITYRKNLIVGGGTVGTDGHGDYMLTYIATAKVS